MEDGLAVNRLIASCPPLDTNSTYCNFLQCLHFAETSVLAEKDGKVVVSIIDDSLLKELAEKEKFKVIEKREIEHGKEILKVLVFSR